MARVSDAHGQADHGEPLGTPESGVYAVDEETTVRMPRGLVQEVLDEYLRARHTAWLDAPHAALDGSTPRQAVTTLVGRGKVETILQTLERQEGPAVADEFHLDEIRRALGLDS